MDTGAVDFADIRYKRAFVDKTMLIKTVLGVSSRILLIAPRRFGKSVNLTMMKRFFELSPNSEEMEENRKLFAGTRIAEDENIMERHQGKYPVLLLDFKSESTISSLESARDVLAFVVQGAYQAHEYLASSDLKDREKEEVKSWCDRNFESNPVKKDQIIFNALKNLAKYLARHWKKEIIVLVDEYDSICCDAVVEMDDEKELQRVIALCSGALSCILKSIDKDIKIARGILTGIAYLMCKGLNKLSNVNEYKFQESNVFSKFYGLTFDELRKLLKKLKLSMNKFDELVEYYNGYRNNMMSIYSIMNYLNTNEKKNWWEKSGMATSLDEVLEISRIKDYINKLLGDIDNEVEIDYFRKIKFKHISLLKEHINNPKHDALDVSIFFNFLLEQGYLTVVKMNGKRAVVKVPNQEIKDEFYESLQLYFKSSTGYNLNFDSIVDCASVFDRFCTSDEKNKKHLSELHEKLNLLFRDIKFNVKNEATLHHVIFLIIFSSKAKCCSEIRILEKNKKRLDLLMIFENTRIGIIIELKYNETSLDGLKQILEKRYYQAFENKKYNPSSVKIEYFVLMGLNMSDDQNVTLNVLLNNLGIKNNCCF